MLKRLVVFLTVVMVASPFSAAAADDPATDSSSGLSSLQKSLLIPGWGQAAEKRCLEAVLFFSAAVLCWAGFIDQNRKGDRAYDLYKAAANTPDAVRFRRETETFDKRRNLCLLGAALVWAANLLDMQAIVAGREQEKNGRSLSLRLDCGEGQTLSLALAYRY
ncbi:MAG: hypothetical protein A2Y56_05005 [Candidatus Aminicenantes bacterium RBG_13_63_10]|nr:MAG: hypothetical protein A2Y56_05005 [Candidatus Aminicenantes bacterium RBG_13_63_10]